MSEHLPEFSRMEKAWREKLDLFDRPNAVFAQPHLPECQRWFTNMPAPDECPACEMFRACEQRVRMEVLHQKNPFALWCIDKGYAAGYWRGVAAAREAVAALESRYDWPAVYGPEALAAIDGLVKP